MSTVPKNDQVRSRKKEFLDRFNVEARLSGSTFRLNEYDVEFFDFDKQGYAIALNVYPNSNEIDVTPSDVLFDFQRGADLSKIARINSSFQQHSMHQFPFYLSILSSIRVLHYHNFFGNVEFPEHIHHLSNLEELYMQIDNSKTRTNICQVAETISGLSKLRKLHIYRSWISSLPDNIGKLQNLEKLIIENVTITSIPETLGDIEKLREIRLINKLTDEHGYNIMPRIKLKKLPKSIGKLINLKKLVCDTIQLETIPDSFVKLSNLSHLKFKNNPVTQFPEEIEKIDFLYHSDGNGFDETIRQWKIKRHKKKFLNQANTELDEADLDGKMPRLSVYDIEFFRFNDRGQPISLIIDDEYDYNEDEVLFEFRIDGDYTEGIDPYYNVIEENYIPRPWDMIYYESESILYHPLFFDFPFDLPIFQSIETFVFTREEFYKVPEAIFNLPNLKTMKIRLNTTPGVRKLIKGDFVYTPNKLAFLSDKIGNVKSLVKLEIVDSSITSLPSEIGELPKLKNLVLKYLDLENIPETIKKNQNLEVVEY